MTELDDRVGIDIVGPDFSDDYKGDGVIPSQSPDLPCRRLSYTFGDARDTMTDDTIEILSSHLATILSVTPNAQLRDGIGDAKPRRSRTDD